MKESYIKNKVVKFLGFKEDKEKLSRMEREREIARIGNMLSHEIDIILSETKRKLATTTHQILKEELK